MNMAFVYQDHILHEKIERPNHYQMWAFYVSLYQPSYFLSIILNKTDKLKGHTEIYSNTIYDSIREKEV